MSVRFGRHKVGKALPCFELIYARSGIQSFSAKDRLVEQYQKMIGCPNGHKLVQTPDLDEITICWPNGLDFSPDMLYEVGKEVKEKTKMMPKKHKGRLLSTSTKLEPFPL